MLQKQDLEELITPQNEICISLFMPLQWQPNQRDANRIRLKNLIKEAEKQLTAVAANPSQLLAPASELLSNGRLNQPQSSGLAIFLKKGFVRLHYLSAEMPELVVVSQGFHTKPLLPLLRQNEQFYILALSQNNIRLYRANRNQIKPMATPNLPANMADALTEEYEKQLQHHMGAKETAVFHGHEVSAEKKGAVRRYFREIDKAITARLHDSDTPLILACVDYLAPVYREVNSYPHLLDQNISGNPDETKSADLHQQGWHLILAQIEDKKEAAIEEYQTLAQTQRTSSNLTKVLTAAHFGRVDTLFTPVGQQQWGQFDATSGQLHIYDRPQPDTVDLLDETAVHTLLNGGTVHAVDPQEMPTEALVTAVFRY